MFISLRIHPQANGDITYFISLYKQSINKLIVRNHSDVSRESRPYLLMVVIIFFFHFLGALFKDSMNSNLYLFDAITNPNTYITASISLNV